jgi:hypothetical protein
MIKDMPEVENSDVPPAIFAIKNEEGVCTIAGGSDEGLWSVIAQVKQASSPGVLLSAGDTIKLGRVKFRVKEVQLTETVESVPIMQPENDLFLGLGPSTSILQAETDDP